MAVTPRGTEGQPGVDFMRNPYGWAGKPGNMLDPSLGDHWNRWACRPGTPQGYMVYLGEAMRREATAGEG